MEHETFISGIGGQGIQLVSKMFAVAAMENDRHVMLNGVYGGEMRGGKSLATVVIGSRPLKALPVTAHASGAVVLHPNFWQEHSQRLRADALIVADEEIAGQLSPLPTQHFVTVRATRLAREIGNPQVMGMILISAYATLTELVTGEQLLAAMRGQVPPHRAQHNVANEKALEAGRLAVTPGAYRVDLNRAEERAVA